MSVIKETKIFDPADGFSPFTDLAELTDATVTKRGNQWWMYLAGEVNEHEGIPVCLYSGLPGDRESSAYCPVIGSLPPSGVS
jgi:hypothetical protein